jgi:hypothetical protein
MEVPAGMKAPWTSQGNAENKGKRNTEAVNVGHRQRVHPYLRRPTQKIQSSACSNASKGDSYNIQPSIWEAIAQDHEPSTVDVPRRFGHALWGFEKHCHELPPGRGKCNVYFFYDLLKAVSCTHVIQANDSITESAVINESIVWDWRHFYVSGEDDIGAGSSDLARGSLAAYLRGSSNFSGFLCPIRLDKF